LKGSDRGALSNIEPPYFNFIAKKKFIGKFMSLLAIYANISKLR
jgi:hypothetical protein